MVHFGEWSTSFPEKGGNRAIAPKSRELVVHFGEWSTGFSEKGRNQAKAQKRRELVVYFQEWSTGFPEKGRNQAKAPKSREPVVHFGEWTTSSGYLGPALPLLFQQALQIPELGGYAGAAVVVGAEADAELAGFGGVGQARI